MWVRTDIDSNVVAELFNYDPTGTIYSGFKVYPVTGPLASYVTQGYTVNDAGEFSPPSVQYLVDQLLAVTANKRWSEQQVTRITHKGVSFFADKDTRANIGQNLQVAERMERMQAGSFQSSWKTPEGFVTLNYADMEAVGMKLAGAFQAQFDKENDVTDLVLAADDTVTDKFTAWREAMDAAWPRLEPTTPTEEPPADGVEPNPEPDDPSPTE